MLCQIMHDRVMERYPQNGQLLKAYGRFLEHVKGEPSMANKFYRCVVGGGEAGAFWELLVHRQ